MVPEKIRGDHFREFVNLITPEEFLRVNLKRHTPHNYEECDLFYEFVNLITVYPGWDSNPQPKR